MTQEMVSITAPLSEEWNALQLPIGESALAE